MQIKWLAIKKNSLINVEYCPIDGNIWIVSGRVGDDAIPHIIWLPSKNHKYEALLLLSLGLSKQEIEEHFNTGK